MKKIFHIAFMIVFVPSLIFSAVPKYSLFEVSDINNRFYINPFDFQEIEYKVTFTSPTSQIYKVLGFFDGNSETNQIWRARFAPMELGEWHYSASFSDGSIAGNGRFEVVPSALHGPVVRDPVHPFKFMHHDGTPIFILGNTIYNILGTTKSEWETVLSNQLKLCAETGFNKVRFAPCSEHEYKNNPVGWNAHPWLERSDGTIDYLRYNLSHWRKIEDMVQRFGLQGVITDFIFVMHELHIDDGLGDPYSKQRKQYYQYAMARLHGFWNMGWDLENEANEIHTTGNRDIWENYDLTWYDTFGKLVASLDPYIQNEPSGFGRMLAVHDNNTPPDFSWANHSKLQWKTTVPQALLFRIDPLINTSYRGYNYQRDVTRAGKPVVYEEYGYEGEQIIEYLADDKMTLSKEIKTDNMMAETMTGVPGLPHSQGDKGDRQRRAIWTIITAGAYGSYGDKTSLFDDKGHQIDPGPYGRPYISGDIRGSTEIGTRYLSVLCSFIRNELTEQQFQTMLPHHDLIVNAKIMDNDQTRWENRSWHNYPKPPMPPYPMAFCLADPGKTYLVYLPYGGWVELDLTAADNSKFQVTWLDPRTGKEFKGDPDVITGDKPIRFNPVAKAPARDPGDWVLFLERR
jgi:hypothetical protein